MSLLSCYGTLGSGRPLPASVRSHGAGACRWDEHVSPNAGIPEYYHSERHKRRMRGKRKLKLLQGADRHKGEVESRRQQSRRGERGDHAGPRVAPPGGGTTTLASLAASTFGFERHDGTSPDSELAVVRRILQREGLLARLSGIVRDAAAACADPPPRSRRPRRGGGTERACAGGRNCGERNAREALRVLNDCRTASLNLALSIMEWRRSQESFESLPLRLKLRPFVFRRRGYMLKMCHDLDFVSGFPWLIDVMQTTKEKVVNNPLMLQNNLCHDTDERLERSLQEYEREENGKASRENSEEMRLHKAELALLMEVHMNEAPAANEHLLHRLLDAAFPSTCSDRQKRKPERLPPDLSFREKAEERSHWLRLARAQLACLSSPVNDITPSKQNFSNSQRSTSSTNMLKSSTQVPQEIICFKASKCISTNFDSLPDMVSEKMQFRRPEVLSVLPPPRDALDSTDNNQKRLYPKK